MNVFLDELSDTFSRDKIILVCDGAARHKSGSLRTPENIELIFMIDLPAFSEICLDNAGFFIHLLHITVDFSCKI